MMVEYSNESQFDNQGRFFWRLVKEANWTTEQVTTLLLSKFRVTHWNVLKPKERKQAIGIMKTYVKKATEVKEKRLRQQINAVWIKAGHTRDELHDAMLNWGFGISLRALPLKELIAVLGCIRKSLKQTNLNNGDKA
jgi:hypothetical protein